jgi:hypothetical protein
MEQLTGPFTEAEIIAARDEILKTDFTKDYDGWERWVDLKLPGDDSCVIFRRFVPSNQLFMYKTLMRMDYSAKDYFTYTKDYEYRKTWDPAVQEVTCVANENDNEVWYWLVKYPWPLDPRDYLFYRRCMDFPDENLHVMVARAVPRDDHGKYRADIKGTVRVQDLVSTAAIRGIGENKMEVLCVYFDDPKGNIPKSIINWAAEKLIPKSFEDNKKAMNKYLAEKLRPQPENST